MNQRSGGFIMTTIKQESCSTRFWLLVSLTLAGSYGVLALKEGLASDYVIQDDVRQHVFWMLRFTDPELFPQDLIADYFQSVAPLGYSSLYRLAAYIGIDPLLFNKFLPLAISLSTTYYCFLFCQQIFPVAFGCGITSILFSQSLWFKDDLVSATPRAFVYPFFLAFLYYLTQKSLFPCLLAIAGVGFFYPQYLLICGGILVWQLAKQFNKRKLLQNFSSNYIYLFGLVVACFILLLYAVSSSEYGPTITRAEALQLPEFHPKGRVSFFDDNFWNYIVEGRRSGLINQSLFTPVTLLIGLFLPILRLFPHQFVLIKQIKPHLQLLFQLTIVSVLMFGLSHAFLFKLHLPSRYTVHSFKIILAIAAGISITVILETLWRRLQRRVLAGWHWKMLAEKILLIGLGSAIALSIFAYPCFVRKFPITRYGVGTFPGLYQFLRQQPKNTMVASLVAEADYLPTFAQRSVLVSHEYAIPYHVGYYRLFRQRVGELITAQYSSDSNILQQFITQYQISFFLVQKSSFTAEYIEQNSWLMSYQPEAQSAVDSLKEFKQPALAKLGQQCTVFTEAELSLVATDCILDSVAKNSTGQKNLVSN